MLGLFLDKASQFIPYVNRFLMYDRIEFLYFFPCKIVKLRLKWYRHSNTDDDSQNTKKVLLAKPDNVLFIFVFLVNS